MQIFRTKRPVVERDQGFKIDCYAHETIHTPVEISRAASFQSRQFAHVIVGIRRTGNQYLSHSFRFVRLPPTMGRSPKVERLEALAIKTPWLEAGGNWKARYLERTRMFKTLRALSSHILQMHRNSLVFLSDVEPKGYFNAPPWAVQRSSDPVSSSDKITCSVSFGGLFHQLSVFCLVFRLTVRWPSRRRQSRQARPSFLLVM